MTEERLEVYSHESNAAVVRMPERRFPGLVIQGDTLASLAQLASEVVRGARPVVSPDVLAIAEALREQLVGYLHHYERVLAEHEIPLPYVQDQSTSS